MLNIIGFTSLLQFYGLTDSDIPKQMQPSFVHSVEMDELNIACGLQDRVVQCYEGVVYMDFDRDHMDKHGHGGYEVIDPSVIANAEAGGGTFFSSEVTYPVLDVVSLW